MNRESKMQRKLLMEPIEPRMLLAGNVVASISGGSLFLTGDNVPNTISVETAGMGKVRVAGFNDAQGFATRVNGVANASVVLNGFTGNVHLAMSGGSDVVRLTNLTVNGQVNAQLGDGNDELIVGRHSPLDLRFGLSLSGAVNISRELLIFGANGNDLVTQNNVQVGLLGHVDLGAGNDTLQVRPRVDGASFNDMQGIVTYNSNFSVFTGSGSDLVDARGLRVVSRFLIDDTTEPLTVELHGVRVNSNMNLYGSAQADFIRVDDTRVANEMVCLTESGTDDVSLAVDAKQLTLNSGTGEDRAFVHSSTIDRIFAHMGDGKDSLELYGVNGVFWDIHAGNGNDLVYVHSSKVANANLYGDAGFDRFRRSHSEPNQFGQLHTFGFEQQEFV
jgi:hypothetical protein